MKRLVRKSLAALMLFTFLFTVMFTNLCITSCMIEIGKDTLLSSEIPSELVFAPHPFNIRYHYRRDEDLI